MSTVLKIIIGAVTVVALTAAGFFIKDALVDSKQNVADTPEKIAADYKDLLNEAEQLRTSIGANCENKNDANSKIESLEKKLADLAERKKQWLDNVPKLPDVEPTVSNGDNPLGRPGSEVPELSSDVPPLPDITGDAIEHIPEMPKINLGRPGSEVPELSSDVPPLPDIKEVNIIDPDEPIIQMDANAQKIGDILRSLKDLCRNENLPQKTISDKCTDACKRHKDCAAYTEDVTVADLVDAYDACMEECPTWPKAMVNCINSTEIKTPNDCVGFVQCRVPQFYEEKFAR